VFEQFDWLGDVAEDRTFEDRLISCFVAVKPPDDSRRPRQDSNLGPAE
jgi:hypothetical protein